LREEHRHSVFENTEHRTLFGPKKGKITRERRRLLNEERHDLYSTSNIIRVKHIKE
jgi:hypothetical protein